MPATIAEYVDEALLTTLPADVPVRAVVTVTAPDSVTFAATAEVRVVVAVATALAVARATPVAVCVEA